MIPIFKLLGMVLDETSYETKFEIKRDGIFCIVKCDDPDLIGELFLPLFGDEDAEELYHLLEKSEWFCANIMITQNQIMAVAIENNFGEQVLSEINERLLKILSEVGMDDSYFTICQEISKKC